MDWDAVLESLPINKQPDTITALDYARERFFDRGDNDVFYEGETLCNAIDVGFGLVKICILFNHEWIDIPDYTELQVKWD
jgi:hypothetical protein